MHINPSLLSAYAGCMVYIYIYIYMCIYIYILVWTRAFHARYGCSVDQGVMWIWSACCDRRTAATHGVATIHTVAANAGTNGALDPRGGHDPHGGSEGRDKWSPGAIRRVAAIRRAATIHTVAANAGTNGALERSAGWQRSAGWPRSTRWQRMQGQMEPWSDPQGWQRSAVKWSPAGSPNRPGSAPAQPNGALQGAQTALDQPLCRQTGLFREPKPPWIGPCAAKWSPAGSRTHSGSTPVQAKGALRGAETTLDRPLCSQMEPCREPKPPRIDPCAAKWSPAGSRNHP